MGKHALIAHQRYAHSKQFKRTGLELRRVRSYLGRVRRDVVRKIKRNERLDAFSPGRCLWLSPRAIGDRTMPVSDELRTI